MSLVLPLAQQWKFRRCESTDPEPGAWTIVELPHSPFVADLDGRDHWFGECDYERTLQLPANAPTGRIALHVGAAMHTTVAFVDEREVARHEGGYLPFEVDLTETLRDGQPHTLRLRLDNRDNPDVPPGKPHADLDFCWYGGLYRDVELRCYPTLHLTDAVAAGEIGGGGVFVRTLEASEARATLSVRVHVRNTAERPQAFSLESELWSGDDCVARTTCAALVVEVATAQHWEHEMVVEKPRLWSPESPALHRLKIILRAPDGSVIDERVERCGIRRIAFSRSRGLELNGRAIRPRGTNRHQEYPYAGYAVPPAAQRRDVRRIKEAGFDYVRLSHYPQSPAFLDACDELGILVMNAIPGWQFIGGEKFRDACERNARDLIRRDRNHPCVILWELSLNETAMDDAFMARMQAVGHEEYPGDQMFTCGWIDRYDVFVHSRQHGEIHRWQNGDKALVIAEYGDWEFYASNHGFDQKTGAGVFARTSNSRQRRADGERGLRQQAENHILALNDALASPAVCDGQWAMFDYARGYDPIRAACGVMDMLRLPKFSWWFYRSQRAPREDGGAAWTGGPVVFIASHWTPASDLRVLVFSNCDEVELTLNGESLGRVRSAWTWNTQHLPHPPFVFDLPTFTPGRLEAAGFIAGHEVARHAVATPGKAVAVKLSVDAMPNDSYVGEPDLLIAHARVLDTSGTLCVNASPLLRFSVEGAAELLGPAEIAAEAGIASTVIRVPAASEGFSLRVKDPADQFPAATLGWSRAKPMPVQM